ncbi:MAG TPA: DUF3352 domain-containing protein, partial [Jatrophihabitans sp.]|nr:DUF3352 domain-containing protein [Jatrophihabitans sp.]
GPDQSHYPTPPASGPDQRYYPTSPASGPDQRYYPTPPASGPNQPYYPPPPASGPDQPYYPPPLASGSDIYLSNPYLLAPPPRKAGPAKKIIAGVGVVAVLAGGAVAAYAYTVLASGGIQPERVLPATTVAFAKLDLDPAAGQKIAAYRLSAKFPAISKGASNLDEEKHAILSEFFGDESDLDYTTEIKPWLGDRIAVAAVPDSGSDSGLDPVLAVAYTNEAKMKAAFSKVARTEPDFGYATIDGYALVSDSQQHAEAVLAGVRRATLANAEHYRSDLKSLHGDQIAVGWADLAATVAALKAGTHSGSSTRLDDLDRLNSLPAKGRIVIGAHANSDYLEVSAVSHQELTGAPRAAGKPVNGTLAKLAAADTSAALEVTGLGDSLSEAWNGASAVLGLGEDFQDLIDETGLQLPGDLAALFGTDATLSMRMPQGVSGEPEIAAQVSTSGGARALQLLDSLGRPFGFPSENLHARLTADGYLLSTSAGYDPRPQPGALTLGADPTFQKAVPDRAGAGLIGYVNIGAILDADPEATAKDKSDWKHLGAVGLTVVPTSDGSRMTLRLTTR